MKKIKVKVRVAEDPIKVSDEEIIMSLTPKGWAAYALMQCELISDMFDPRVDEFWDIFSEVMEKRMHQ